MFNLDQAIVEWRLQMLAAGIKTPVPLEELESHLREEIERQMRSGLSEAEAFRSAAQEMGPASVLKSEFGKNEGVSTKRIGILAVCIGTVIVLQTLARYCGWGQVSRNEQFLWFVAGVTIILAGLGVAVFNFSLGQTRDVRIWKLVGITYSVFAVWISMLPVYSLFTVPKFSTAFNFTDRILFFSAMTVSLLSIPGWRYGHKYLPVIRTKRTRTAIGVACCLLGLASMSAFWGFAFPHMGQWHAMVVLVLITWGWAAMALLGGVGYGLAEAAHRQTESVVESTSES